MLNTSSPPTQKINYFILFVKLSAMLRSAQFVSFAAGTFKGAVGILEVEKVFLAAWGRT